MPFSVPPFLLKTGDNPNGIEQAVFDGIEGLATAARDSRAIPNFYNVDVRREASRRRGGEEQLTVAVGASPKERTIA